MFTVYVLKSLVKNWFYVGMSQNVSWRCERHNSGRERSTMPYRPFEVVYVKSFGTRVEARDHEKFLKIRSNKEKLLRKLKLI